VWEGAVGRSASSPGARNAARHLADQLITTYRRHWNRPEYVERGSSGHVHYAAVAHVLAGYLHHHPREGRPQDREVLSGQLLPLVSRALRGERLSRQTLEIFIEAFGIRKEHADELRWQWEERIPARVVTGSLPPLEGTPSDRTSRYKTTSLHEFHYLGPDGQPTHHRTVRDIESMVDDLSVYRYRFDSAHVSVERIHGGTPGEPYIIGASQWAVDIRLPRTLKRGQSHTLEFVTRFRNPRFDEPCCRRVAHERFENVTMLVEFHQEKLPRSVWWAQWKDYREPNIIVIGKERAELDSDNTVSHQLAVLDHAVVGFMWEW
jgi:hypothetical protein